MQLIKYEAACHALAEAHSIDEVKDIADKAQALMAYAKQANDRALELMAYEIRLRAQRKLGKLSADMPKAPGLNSGNYRSGIDRPSGTKSQVLQEYGVKKRDASRYEKLASVPDDEFQKIINDCKRDGRFLSSEAIASKAIREQKRAQELSRLNGISAQDIDAVVGDYDVIVIDPPWPMQKIDRDARPNQTGFDYPTLREQDLEQLQLPAAKSCHVWLWTTHKFLPMALRLLPKWGLAYICTFVWHKPGGFQPFDLPQYNCEFALYARKGTPIFTALKDFNVCFTAPRSKHSEKPEAFYSLVRDHTAGRRLDLFARRKIAGFEGWGQEYETLTA